MAWMAAKIDDDAKAEERPGTDDVEREQRRALRRQPGARKETKSDRVQTIVQKSEDRVVDPAPDNAGDHQRNGARDEVDRTQPAHAPGIALGENGSEQQTGKQGKGEGQNDPDTVMPKRGPEHAVTQKLFIVGEPDEVLGDAVVPGKKAVADHLKDRQADEKQVEAERRQQKQIGGACLRMGNSGSEAGRNRGSGTNPRSMPCGWVQGIQRSPLSIAACHAVCIAPGTRPASPRRRARRCSSG